MRIVIDMQGAQTESRFRGIGRYTMSFVNAVIRNQSEHDIILVLNGMFPETIGSIRMEFEGLLPQENIKVWYAEGPVAEIDEGNKSRRETAELLREAFISHLNPDVVHICSLFEGYIDDAVNSIGRFDGKSFVSVALYDLIPLLNEEHYLEPNPSYAKYYRNKIDNLKKANVCLAISEYSRQEGLAHLPFKSDSIVNISTAIEPMFKPVKIDLIERAALLDKFNIRRSFVLYTGGGDERKNLPRLIDAYAELSHEIRSSHQLLFAGKMSDGQIGLLKEHAKKRGLDNNELSFTGYITDEELVKLYNLCKLFVFPSWHEGFGLPALEAMACGAAVITANSTSLPEVVGLVDAQFDPLKVSSISEKLTAALIDEDFRSKLVANGLQRATLFSWDISAQRAISAWETTLAEYNNLSTRELLQRPKLAFVSPLPPERTGIADYSAELLPELSKYYDVDVIVVQDEVADKWINLNCGVKTVAWFEKNFECYERVLYQVGNSPYHHHMLAMIKNIPGTVVLHDFYLSGLISWLQQHAGVAHAWDEQLYFSHGYKALALRYKDSERCKNVYPVNFPIFQYATGVIVHSLYSKNLARNWYLDVDYLNWHVIPQLRELPEIRDRDIIRKRLGFKKDDFVICSFGFLDYSKLNHRLLESWLASDLAECKKCYLIFVGENHGGDYGKAILSKIESSSAGGRIQITGFVSSESFIDYLELADLTVQLRTQSRGETSRAVLDCMAYGKPLIVNANGSMAELDKSAVIMLNDEFTDGELTEVINEIYSDKSRCCQLGKTARNVVAIHNAPDNCAKLYCMAIESDAHKQGYSRNALISTLGGGRCGNDENEIIKLAKFISLDTPLARPQRRILLDVTATRQSGLKTGIERVAKAITLNFLDILPPGYRVEPVYLTNEPDGGWGYRFARDYMLELLGGPQKSLNNDVLSPMHGDILLTLDISGHSIVAAAASGLFEFYKNHGVKIYSLVHDLLPITMPEVFPPGADISHSEWLQTISRFNGAICVSKSVANDLAKWRESQHYQLDSYSIDWSHHGADVETCAPSIGMPENALQLVDIFASKPTFLMVGTIEPRKGYLQTIYAFNELWNAGYDINLVIVGREGWKQLPDSMRRDIPETISAIDNNKELNKHLFWLDGISDEFLEKVYSHSSCLIAASYGEGFGLPLIEGAQHNLPIIARDIPVFREVAGAYASYFENSPDAEYLQQTIIDWLNRDKSGDSINRDAMSWLTWKQSAMQLLNLIL